MAERQTTGARALARKAVLEQVSEMTLDLCTERGYAETAVDDICEVAGISRSTFFRYFSSKDSALLAGTEAAGDHLIAALTERPESEPIWESLRYAFSALTDNYAADPTRSRKLVHLVVNEPSLAAAHHEKNVQIFGTLQPEIARRIGSDPHDPADPRPAALIAAALGCVDAALAAWITSDSSTPLDTTLGRAMEILG